MNTNIEQVKNVLAALGIQLADNVVLNDNVLCTDISKECSVVPNNDLVDKIKERKKDLIDEALLDMDFDEIEDVFVKMRYTYGKTLNSDYCPNIKELKETARQLCSNAIDSIIERISPYQIEDLKEILNADVCMLSYSETGRFRGEARLYYSDNTFDLAVDVIFTPEQSDYADVFTL